MWFPLFHVRAETIGESREFRLSFIDDGFEVTDLFHAFHSPTVHTNKHPERRGRPVLIGCSARRPYRNMGIVSIIVITMPAGILMTFIRPVIITSFTRIVDNPDKGALFLSIFNAAACSLQPDSMILIRSTKISQGTFAPSFRIRILNWTFKLPRRLGFRRDGNG